MLTDFTELQHRKPNMWHHSPVPIALSVDQCQNLVCVGEIRFNPVLLAMLVVAAISLMLFALRTSGGWANHWYGHRPVTWFVLALLLPELAVILIAVNAVAARRRSKKEKQHILQ